MSTPAGPDHRRDEPVRVLVVMGVSGTGKTTVAAALADRLGWPMAEGDDLHPASNVAKMAAGTLLTDEDRWPWLERVGGWVRDRLDAGERGVITCSALRRAYRDRLRGPGVVFVHLDGDRETIAHQLGQRQGHFMPGSLLASQLDTLEPLQPDERGVVVPLGQDPAHEVEQVVRTLGLD